MLKEKAEYILTGILGFFFCLCVMLIIKDIVNYRIAEKEYADLKAGSKQEERDQKQSDRTDRFPDSVSYPEEKDYFDRLYDINHDLVCILTIPSLEISYPVVQGSDNERYLNYTFEGKKNPAGCLFMDYENDRTFSDHNTFIYGHNMKDGSMFGRLKQMTKEGFDKAATKAYITTKEGSNRYKFESIQIVDINSYNAKDPGTKDLLTLYTCWGNNKSRRLLVTFSKEDNGFP